jgi:peptide deformylase
VVVQEGCLSIPGLNASVACYEQISMSYQTPRGKARRVTLQGYRARIAQHKLGHLNGKLFIDRCSKMCTVRSYGTFDTPGDAVQYPHRP